MLHGGAGISPWPMDSPHWTEFIPKDPNLSGEPMLEQECEREGTAERGCDELITTPHSLSPCAGSREVEREE